MLYNTHISHKSSMAWLFFLLFVHYIYALEGVALDCVRTCVYFVSTSDCHFSLLLDFDLTWISIFHSIGYSFDDSASHNNISKLFRGYSMQQEMAIVN